MLLRPRQMGLWGCRPGADVDQNGGHHAHEFYPLHGVLVSATICLRATRRLKHFT